MTGSQAVPTAGGVSTDCVEAAEVVVVTFSNAAIGADGTGIERGSELMSGRMELSGIKDILS